MEDKDLIKFNKNVQFLKNEIARYEDEEGNIKVLSIGMLFCQVEYLRVTQEAKKVMVFNKEVNKNMKFDKEFTTIPQKDEKNPLILRDVQIEVEKMWKVRNGLGFFTICNNKEEAKQIAEEMNKKILDLLEEK